MSTTPILPELLPHGTHIRPEYADGAWGQSTDSERSEGGLSGTLRRFRKHQRASDQPQAFGWIKAVYPDAIEYSGMKQATEGMIMVGAFFGLMIGGGGMGCGIFALLMPFLLGNPETPIWFYIAFIALGLVMLIGSTALTLWMIFTPLRRVYRTPRDLPIIFDRKARKVYRMLLDVQPGLLGLLKPWPVKALAYDWDLLDAEHDAQVMGSTATVQRLHRLVFVVRKSADDPTIIDHFEIGNGMAQTDNMVAPMWEHIRRFMEDNGPHLPRHSEPLDSRLEEIPTWWQACGEGGPFGSRYGWWWRNQTFLTAFYHLIIVAFGWLTVHLFILTNGHFGTLMGLLGVWIVLSINWGQGTGIWLQAHTSRLYDWPPAVKSAIGTAIRKGTGWPT